MQHSVLDSMLGGAAGQSAGRNASPRQLPGEAAPASEDASDGEAADEPESQQLEPAQLALQQMAAAEPHARSVPASAAFGGQQTERELPTERTVFVRGLPLDATQQQLQAAMSNFGPVKACR